MAGISYSFNITAAARPRAPPQPYCCPRHAGQGPIEAGPSAGQAVGSFSRWLRRLQGVIGGPALTASWPPGKETRCADPGQEGKPMSDSQTVTVPAAEHAAKEEARPVRLLKALARNP